MQRDARCCSQFACATATNIDVLVPYMNIVYRQVGGRRYRRPRAATRCARCLRATAGAREGTCQPQPLYPAGRPNRVESGSRLATHIILVYKRVRLPCRQEWNGSAESPSVDSWRSGPVPSKEQGTKSGAGWLTRFTHVSGADVCVSVLLVSQVVTELHHRRLTVHAVQPASRCPS
jgi:hypothetical protein